MATKSPNGPVSGDTEHSIEPLAVGISEGCRILGVRKATLYREINAGRIKALKARRRTILPLASLRAWLASLPQSKAA